MNINPETKPVSEIFSIESKTIYKIPFYQRNYSWNTQHIEDLFNDIKDENKGYYIGNLLVSKNDNIEGINILDVVDGQQRLTTISIFLLAIYERLEVLYNEQITIDKSLQKKIINLQYDIERKLVFENKIPKLELLEKDAEVYNNYLGILDNKSKSKFGNRAFVKRYKFIFNLFEDMESYEEIYEFYDKLNSIEILRITVDDLSDAFTVFSSLNAKGLPLTLIDLLKSKYLSVAISEISTDEAMKKWNTLIEIFSDQNKNPNSNVITQFLLNNYDTFINENKNSITKSSALRKYEELFTEKKHKYMDELIENAKLYSYITPIIDSNDDIELPDEVEYQINRLNKLESSQSFPLILFLLKNYYKNKLSSERLIEVLNFLTNYYVRRNIVLKPKASNIRAKMIEIIRNLKNINNLNDNVLEITKEKLYIIMSTDLEFKSALKNSVYDISPQTVRFILIDIERKYGNYFNKQIVDNLDEYNESKKGKKTLIWTLEHILPQGTNLKSEWANMISPDDIDLAPQLQMKHTHRLGNLTLTGYNSELSDKGFIEKRDYKVDKKSNYTGLRTNLFINRSIPIEGSSIELMDSWTIQDIERRTNTLAELAFKIYKI